MDHDPRDEIWNAAWDTYYDSHYHEIVADKLIGHWQVFDQLTKVLIAITASTSAIAGWSLWTDARYQKVWACIAGGAALLSIIHATMSVADRLEDSVELKRVFSGLRVDLETFRQNMRIDPEFSVEEFKNRLMEFRKRYGDCQRRVQRDILRTRWLKKASQRELDLMLKNSR